MERRVKIGLAAELLEPPSRSAANIKDLELPMLLPGIRVNTSPDNFYPIRQLQLSRFNGESWELFGDLFGD